MFSQLVFQTVPNLIIFVSTVFSGLMYEFHFILFALNSALFSLFISAILVEDKFFNCVFLFKHQDTSNIFSFSVQLQVTFIFLKYVMKLQ